MSLKLEPLVRPHLYILKRESKALIGTRKPPHSAWTLLVVIG